MSFSCSVPVLHLQNWCMKMLEQANHDYHCPSSLNQRISGGFFWTLTLSTLPCLCFPSPYVCQNSCSCGHLRVHPREHRTFSSMRRCIHPKAAWCIESYILCLTTADDQMIWRGRVTVAKHVLEHSVCCTAPEVLVSCSAVSFPRVFLEFKEFKAASSSWDEWKKFPYVLIWLGPNLRVQI